MRNFLISAVCLALLIGVWGIFDFYSNGKIEGYQTQIDNTVISAVEAGRWDEAASAFSLFSDDWRGYRKAASFFLDTQDLNEADCTIEKTAYYIQAEDLSNASGELASLKDQLLFLHYNETLSAGNIL